MTVSLSSRYRGQPIINAMDAAGVSHPTVAIRRHMPTPAGAIDYQHRVTGVEDIEYLAWRYFGNGEVWWRIADANELRFPLDLRPGESVAVPTDGRPDLSSRERVF